MQRRITMLVVAGALAAVVVGQLAGHHHGPGETDPPMTSPRYFINGLLEVIEQDPDDPVARLKLGMIYLGMGDHEQAEKWFAAGAAIDPALYEDAMCGLSSDEGGAAAEQGGETGDTVYPVPGPDIIVGNLHQLQRWGRVGNITAYSVGTVSCNAGDTVVQWDQSTNEHPVIAQHMYRYKDGRFEMIGQSWVKHGFAALTNSFCFSQFGYGCTNPGTSQLLGIGCSDPYGSNLNGSHQWLGPKHEINPTTGYFPYPYGVYPNDTVIAKRLQVHDDNIKPSQNVDAIYYVEGHYIAADVAAAGNALNNVSYRRINVSETSPNVFDISFAPGHATVRELPAIYAWESHDPEVVIQEIDVPADGRFIVAYRVRSNGDGTWNYEYAVHNFNSDRSGGSFAVPIGEDATVTNIGFRSVPWHSGAPYSNDAWAVELEGGVLRWSTDDYDDDVNANALRWGTLYNFRFDADAPPAQAPGEGSLGLFKPAIDGLGPDVMSFAAPVPILKVGDLDNNGVVNVFDLLILLAEWGPCDDAEDCAADLDGNGMVNVFDLLILLANWG